MGTGLQCSDTTRVIPRLAVLPRTGFPTLYILLLCVGAAGTVFGAEPLPSHKPTVKMRVHDNPFALAQAGKPEKDDSENIKKVLRNIRQQLAQLRHYIQNERGVSTGQMKSTETGASSSPRDPNLQVKNKLKVVRQQFTQLRKDIQKQRGRTKNGAQVKSELKEVREQFVKLRKDLEDAGKKARLPDLVIAKALVKRLSDCPPGRPLVFVEATVRNIGGGNSPSHTVNITVRRQGKEMRDIWRSSASRTLPELRPGGTVKFDFPLDISAETTSRVAVGEHKFSLSLDTDALPFQEGDRANNSYGPVKLTVPLGICASLEQPPVSHAPIVKAPNLPDLVIETASIRLTTESQCRGREPLLFVKAVIRNRGNASFPAWQQRDILLAVESQSQAKAVLRGSLARGLPRLGPGEATEVNFPIYNSTRLRPQELAGSHMFNLFINGRISPPAQEADTSNNAYKPLTVSIPANFCAEESQPIQRLATLAQSPPQQLTNGDLLFQNPVYKGYRLDWCLGFARDCGEAAATAWCQSQGYLRAGKFDVDRNIGLRSPTLTFADNRVCANEGCGGFKYIVCETQDVALNTEPADENAKGRGKADLGPIWDLIGPRDSSVPKSSSGRRPSRPSRGVTQPPFQQRPELRLAQPAVACSDLQIERINFQILKQASKTKGWVRIRGIARNAGGADFVSQYAKQQLLLYEVRPGSTPRLVQSRPFDLIRTGEQIEVVYDRPWDNGSGAEAEFPPSYRVELRYSGGNNDCNTANNIMERNAAQVNGMFR